MSRSMIKQQNSGATAHVVLYTPRQSTKQSVHPAPYMYENVSIYESSRNSEHLPVQARV